MKKFKDLKYPTYGGFSTSLYRINAVEFIPTVKNKDMEKVFPWMLAWQFPDLDLCDMFWDELHRKAEADEACAGHCMSKGEHGVHPDVKDSQDVSMHTGDFKIDRPVVDENGNQDSFFLGTINLETWLKHCLMEYHVYNPMYNGKHIMLEHSTIQYQHYFPGGGFKNQHSERNYTTLGEFTGQQRELVFMMYLNDLKEADNKGGTHFTKQEITLPCKKGLTAIWPAGHEFAHVGSVHDTKCKGIITGWFVTHPPAHPAMA